MAKLGSYYGLCPLIDSKSLLGISADSEKGVVLVTLGKNIASKYKLSDQKQLYSWRTKEKFSSPVIYDTKLSKYLAVFNQSYIKLWDSEEENLDKLKKYKFNKQINSILSGNGNTLILFQNGSIYTLEDALQMRRTLNPEDIISDGEQICEVIYRKLNEQFYIGLIVKCSNGLKLYWTKSSSGKFYYSQIELQRTDFILKGFVFHIDENMVNFLTLWSDGRIFSYHLEDNANMTIPGQLFTVMESISIKNNVSMLSLDENYIAMYGANSNEEGAMLIIYNTQFKVIQSRQPFKLFTNDAKLWCFENNLLLPVGHNLAVIPFYLESEQLAALVGSHKVIQSEPHIDTVIFQEFEEVFWDNKLIFKKNQLPEALKCKINDFLLQGLPESIIIEEMLPNIFKERDIISLSLCIKYFSDIPEKFLVKILKFIMTLESSCFPDQTEHLSKLFPSNLQPIARTEIIDTIFCKHFSDNLMLPHLRSELILNDVLTLISYICFLRSEDGHALPSMSILKTEMQLVNWSYIILDANYQQLLLSKDESVKVVLIQFSQLVEDNMKYFEDLRCVSSLLSYLKQRKLFTKSATIFMKYSIEQINLY